MPKTYRNLIRQIRIIRIIHLKHLIAKLYYLIRLSLPIAHMKKSPNATYIRALSKKLILSH